MSKRWIATVFAGALIAFTPAMAAAQTPTDIVFQTGKSWTHPSSGITVPATLAGVPRSSGKIFTAPDLDVSVGFGGKDHDAINFFIFRDTSGSVPIWLAQSQRAILGRKDIASWAAIVPPTSFTPPGQPANSGLKMVYAPQGDDSMTASGIAIFAVNGWYVKMRITSFGKSPAAVSAIMESALHEIRFPAPIRASGAVQPITDCPAKLGFGTAADSKAGAAVLTTGVARPAPTLRAPRWCRDSVLEGNRAVYRPVGTNDRYLLAIGDNGNGASVLPQTGYYSTNFYTADTIFTLVAQDKIPSPHRVIDLIVGDRIIVATPNR
jgi:hypothetical protein